MSSVAEAIREAVQHHQAGHLDTARGLYADVLRKHPDHPVAVNLLGTLSLQQGQLKEAIHWLQQSVQTSHRTDPATWDNLGGAYLASGQLEQAESAFRMAIRSGGDEAKYRFDLGMALRKRGRLDEAIVEFRASIGLHSTFLPALNNLGNALSQKAAYSEAMDVFQNALDIQPNYAAAWNGLGNVLLELGRTGEAVGALERATQLDPQEPRFHCNLGVALKASGNLDAALRCYKTALDRSPQFTEARLNLANLFVSQQRTNDALIAYRAAAEFDSENSAIQLSIGDCLRDLDEHAAAAAAFQKAALHSRQPDWCRLRAAFLCQSVFESSDQIRDYRSGLPEAIGALRPTPIPLEDIESVAVMPPFGLPYHGYDDKHIKTTAAHLYLPTFDCLPDPARSPSARTRVGFVVTNGHEGIFLRCLAGIIERIDSSEFSVCVLAPTLAMVEIRQRLSGHDIDLIVLPDRFASMVPVIRKAELEILYHWECGSDVVDYLLPFAKTAPIQCTGWGLPVTSGIPDMDFYLSSSAIEAVGAEGHYTESLILAPSPLIWQSQISRPNHSATAGKFGFSTSDIIYVCAQNLLKFHPDFDAILAGILRTDPNAVVALVESPVSRISERLKQRFESVMPDVSSRIRLIPRMSYDDYLSLLLVSDVALDPLHYGAGITAYDCLAMGTHLVTLPSEYRRGRFVYACYERLELANMVAGSPQDYVSKACEYANSHEIQTAFQSHLTERQSLLFEDRDSVSAFEQCLRTMLKKAD